ncbi:MAG: two-component sensor histidine kinase [Confluentimicrobium sp.]|jgi:two-component system osmolarity sensor histidine kinase EnvZ|uniref:ATP-binding protein n=1 Tax=Actibacterium sp. TaxID=1872125 RepID=UPI000C4965BE|nr:ATP-binding protein [Actibacterium sp.]MBC56655.1 two-component sensor histidine kinase [Actibacterium sp.]|tara:strand:+ start:1047 stop:2324 length:1278 start_codon:yes stop_codon:yes gene_type:complete
MLNSLFRQNIALLIGVVLVGQVLTTVLIASVIVRPQTVRLAHAAAQVIDAFAVAADGMTPQSRDAFVQVLNREGGAQIIAATTPPEDGLRSPKFLERRFMRALADELASQSELQWQTDNNGHLWIRVMTGGSPLWLTITTPERVGPLRALLLAVAVACAVALMGGVVIQRRLARPLQELAARVREFDPASEPARLSETGPDEIKAVARAFNDMAARLSAIESDRAVMLAGVSHDLRTPLARLRLALEMIATRDRDLIESADRQAVQIDMMLTQFADFARGFETEQRSLVPVSGLLAEAVDLAGMGGDIIVTCQPDLVFHLRKGAVVRALANLLTNAARHGRPPIALSAEVTGDVLRLTVTDAGDGIPAATAQRMLIPFVRGDHARGGGGTGLGLSIAERVARAHGGAVAFTSGGKGFSVTLNLPG